MQNTFGLKIAAKYSKVESYLEVKAWINWWQQDNIKVTIICHLAAFLFIM